MNAQEVSRSFDGVQLAVLTNRFQGIVRAMANTLARAGRSGVINTARDFSCCILTRESELLTMADSLPIHVMRGPDIMAKAMLEHHPDIQPGDAYLHNSPYHGNSHAADHSILIPVFDDGGLHRFTVFAKAHQADCGDTLPTTYMAGARDVYEEGALIFPAVKVQENYKDCEDVVRMCRMRIRVPDQWWGDHLALVGATRIGERRLLDLAEEMGWELLEAYTKQWFDYSEQRMISAIHDLPNGRITVSGAHDPFPNVPEGVPLKVTVEVRSEEAVINIDLRDNPDCVPCGLNATEATARTAVYIGIFNSLDPSVPHNAGSFRRLNVHLRDGCAVGIPHHPASCSLATTGLANRIGNMVQRAIAELGDGAGMAEVGLIMPPSYAVISGHDPRPDGGPFVNQLILAVSAGAASPAADGWLTTSDLGASGMILQDSVEVDELQYPIRVQERHIIPNSEGAGRFCGAPSIYTEYGPVDCSLDAVYTSDGSRVPAAGARGGWSGAPAQQFKRHPSGELTPLNSCARVTLLPDETIVSMCCGGGGYGSPLTRDPVRVQKDVTEAWITRERAEGVYGVVLDAAEAIDEDATAALRAKKAACELTLPREKVVPLPS